MFNKGDRIKLIKMSDDPNPIESGATGTVLSCVQVMDWTQVHVDWDNGRSLSLCVPPDMAVRISNG